MLHLYAQVNQDNVCYSLLQTGDQIVKPNMIQVGENEYMNGNLIGKQYLNGNWITVDTE